MRFLLVPRAEPDDDQQPPTLPRAGSGTCGLMSSFAIFVQLLLATIAFSTLIFKRSKERPMRPIKIWLYDVSKQIVGGVVIHSLNLLAATAFGSSSEREDSNPCIWYFLNIFLDTTFGVGVLYLFLKGADKYFQYKRIEGLRTGEYGNPPQIQRWWKQTLVFSLGLVVMKIVVVIVLTWPFLFTFGEWVLGWTLQNEKLQILFVMLILPLSMNICQFWVIDYILKQKTTEKFPIRIDDDEEDLYGLVGGLEHNSDDEDDSRDEHHDMVGQATGRDSFDGISQQQHLSGDHHSRSASGTDDDVFRHDKDTMAASEAVDKRVWDDDGDFVGLLFDTIMYERAVHRLKTQRKFDFPVKYSALASDFAKALSFCSQSQFLNNPDTAHFAECIRISCLANVNEMKQFVDEHLGCYEIYPADGVHNSDFFDRDLDKLAQDEFSDFDPVAQQLRPIKKNVGFQGYPLTKRHEHMFSMAFAAIPSDTQDMIAAIIHHLRIHAWKHGGSGGGSVLLMDGSTIGVQKYSRLGEERDDTEKQLLAAGGLDDGDDIGSPLRPVVMLPPSPGYNWRGHTSKLSCVDLPSRGMDYGFFACLNRVLMEKYQELLPSPELLNRFQRLKDTLGEFLLLTFPSQSLRVEPFGSFVTGLVSQESDADFCIMGPDVYKHDLLNDMYFLSTELEAYGFTNMVPIPDATVPIVKFHDPISKLECDINTGNYLGAVNSNLIHTYIDIDPRVKPFLFLLKHICRAQGIKSFNDGALSSYAITMMGIVYLQNLPGDFGRYQKPLLPRLQVQPAARMSEEDVRLNHSGMQYSAVSNERRHDIVRTQYDKNLDGLHTKAASDNTMLVSELLIGFFEFHSRHFAYTEKTIHVARGEYVKKSHEERFKERGVPSFRIIDPFLHHRNIAGRCRGESLRRVWQSFSHVYLALSGGDVEKALTAHDTEEQFFDQL
ncbi:hypothetical protein BG004_006545 [Podila humilis]|nr:hypothetical protein BG004_006545 [Podila humilis]